MTVWPDNATKADIWFEVVDEYDGDVIGDLFVIARTQVAGEYKFIAYVGEPYADAVKADEVTVSPLLTTPSPRSDLKRSGRTS